MILLGFIAMTAVPSGLMLILEPDGSILQLPQMVLQSTPFHSFLIPGIILTLVVGGINSIALLLCLFNKQFQYRWAMAGGTILVIWILAQLATISFFHWLQFIYLGIGILVVLIAYQLRGKWAV